MFFFFCLFFILPFKKYQFHKRSVKVFICLLLFVSVCVCLHVRKRLFSSVGKKGYVWNLSLPLFAPSALIPRSRSAVESWIRVYHLSEGLCKRRHRLLFSCRGMDTHFLWLCELKNGVLCSSCIVFYSSFFPVIIPFSWYFQIRWVWIGEWRGESIVLFSFVL